MALGLCSKPACHPCSASVLALPRPQSSRQGTHSPGMTSRGQVLSEEEGGSGGQGHLGGRHCVHSRAWLLGEQRAQGGEPPQPETMNTETHGCTGVGRGAELAPVPSGGVLHIAGKARLQALQKCWVGRVSWSRFGEPVAARGSPSPAPPSPKLRETTVSTWAPWHDRVWPEMGPKTGPQSHGPVLHTAPLATLRPQTTAELWPVRKGGTP